MRDDAAIVYVVDDDPAVRRGLDSLLRSVGYIVHAFDSADAFLAFDRPPRTSCLLLDIRMPGRSGTDLHAILNEREDVVPVIFLTGHGDVPLCVRAMKAGAADFFQKPFDEEALLSAIASAVERDGATRRADVRTAEIAALRATLSPREAEIVALVLAGLSSRDIAAKLSLAEITIKVGRANAMRKMRCRSPIELMAKWGSLST